MGTLLVLRGATDGVNTTGTFDLKCEWFESAVSKLRIDKGLVAKLWSMEVSGAPCTVHVQVTLSLIHI